MEEIIYSNVQSKPTMITSARSICPGGKGRCAWNPNKNNNGDLYWYGSEGVHCEQFAGCSGLCPYPDRPPTLEEYYSAPGFPPILALDCYGSTTVCITVEEFSAGGWEQVGGQYNNMEECLATL
jgi:hypothetical protein